MESCRGDASRPSSRALSKSWAPKGRSLELRLRRSSYSGYVASCHQLRPSKVLTSETAVPGHSRILPVAPWPVLSDALGDLRPQLLKRNLRVSTGSPGQQMQIESGVVRWFDT